MLTLTVLAALSAAVWLYLLLAHGRYWVGDQRLPATSGDAESDGGWPTVVAVVPARDEAAMLPLSLTSLLEQDYAGELRILLVDDASSDGTAEVAAKVAEEVAAQRGDGRELVVVRSDGPPAGWAGKVAAMNRGVQAIAGWGRAGKGDAGARGAGKGDGDAGAGSAGASDASAGSASEGDAGAGGTGKGEGDAGAGDAGTSDASAGTGSAGASDAGAGGAGAGGAGADGAGKGGGEVGVNNGGLIEAGPTYILFTDADIVHAPDSLRRLVGFAQGKRLDLVSLMALLRTETPAERAIVPAFVYSFAQLYPFPRVNRARSRTAAAAGGCMLVRREALAAAGGLAQIAGARIDDVALGRLIKRSRGTADGRVWLGLTTDVRSVRPYPRLADLWDMIARSAYIQLRFSPLLLVGTLLGLLVMYAVPPVLGLAFLAVALGGGGAQAAVIAALGLGAWALMCGSYLPTLRLYGLSGWRALALPAVMMLYGAMTFDSARRHHRGRGGVWKGRVSGVV